MDWIYSWNMVCQKYCSSFVAGLHNLRLVLASKFYQNVVLKIGTEDWGQLRTFWLGSCPQFSISNPQSLVLISPQSYNPNKLKIFPTCLPACNNLCKICRQKCTWSSGQLNVPRSCLFDICTGRHPFSAAGRLPRPLLCLHHQLAPGLHIIQQVSPGYFSRLVPDNEENKKSRRCTVGISRHLKTA